MTIYETRIRHAVPNDSEDIHLWRNDKTSREMSFNEKVIKLSDHEEWFRKKMSDLIQKYS